MNARKTLLALVLLPVALAALSACGRKGDLETPSQAAATARQEAAKAEGAKADEAQPEARPERRFILDALID